MKVLLIFLLLILLIHLIDFTFQLLIGLKANTAIEIIVNHYLMMNIAEYIILICLLLFFLMTVIYSFYKKRA
ncbi:hypothetical protein [Priestia abyssalis]|uniref:hypothetical protein n=1 Tax=Priestia abyssalis TaxID=1221450 RepID=UPI0009955B03|nr:hypothetical protein [Priestia abyssalis]